VGVSDPEHGGSAEHGGSMREHGGSAASLSAVAAANLANSLSSESALSCATRVALLIHMFAPKLLLKVAHNIKDKSIALLVIVSTSPK
jgi:hypothetical protein